MSQKCTEKKATDLDPYSNYDHSWGRNWSELFVKYLRVWFARFTPNGWIYMPKALWNLCLRPVSRWELCSPWSSLCINAKSPSMPYSLPSYRYLPMDENRKGETSEKSHLSKIFGATIAAYSVVVPATAGASLTSFAMQLLCLVRAKKKTWKTDRNRQWVRHMIYTQK